MRHKKITSIFVAIIVLSLLAIMPNLLVNEDGKSSDSSDGLILQIPPVQAQTTPALDTSTIGFIAYYERAVGWTLADTVPAFVSYSDGDNYYDGIVRVWSDGQIGADESNYHYVDVHLRVRADGWILAWLDRNTDDPGDIIYWRENLSTYPDQYATSLSRAIEIVYTVAGIGFPGYEHIGMYDFSNPTASRLLFLGKYASSSARDWYYTIPDVSDLTPTYLIARCYSGYSSAFLRIDGGQVFTGDLDNWVSYVLDPNQYMSKGVQHTVTQYYSSVVLILWAA